MAKSSFERTLEKQVKQAKAAEKQRENDMRKEMIRERASSIVNGQPIINGMRIMDETAELLLDSLLKIHNGKENFHISFSFDALPECILSNVGVEFEKLTQYGMTASANLWMSGGMVDLMPPAFSYFDRKEKAINNNSNKQETDMKFDKDKVFIVHGHDNEAKQEMARVLEKGGFKAIILHEQPDTGMTIIEKIETFSNVGFAVVLYTECDLGRDKNADISEERYRARQNVVFEHGYLIGKLGRSNVAAFVKGKVETPGDISGVVYTPLDREGAWKMSLAKNMKAVGLEVDANKWLD